MKKISEIVQRKVFAELERNKDAILVPAMNVLLSDMTDRIFQDGKDSKNGKIGEYSTRPYVQKIPIPQVKNGKLKSLARKQGRIDTVFVKEGYSEVRRLTGRQNNYVDLNFTGSLFLSIKVVPVKGGFGLAIIGQAEIEKAKENEKRFGKTIFKPTKQEIETLKTEILKNIKRFLN